MSLLQVTDASFGYGRATVLRDINLQIQAGEFLGIIGPNGSGKTTLLKALSGLLKPQGGHVLLKGGELGFYSRQELARIMALVPQNALLPELFTTLDIVLMGRVPHLGLLRYESSADIRTALESMQATGTAHLTDRRMNELSGGERQRVVIARAITQQPQIILLDEPTANLDINYQADILNLLRGLCGTHNLTVIAALHDLNLAAQYCRRLIMLKDGSIYRLGRPWEVIETVAIRDVFGADVTIYPHPVNALPTTLVTPHNHTGNI